MPVDPRHGRTIPSGRPIARLMRAVFARQRVEVLTAIRHRQSMPSLARWDKTIVDHVTPILAMHWHDGGKDALRRIRTAVRRIQWSEHSRSYTRGQVKVPDIDSPTPPIIPLPKFDLVRIDLDFDVFRPEVVTAIAQAAMQFAVSTNATSTMRLTEATQQLRADLSAGLSQGESLAALTTRVGAIFADPTRARSIAMTEASRAMHAGQIEAARQTGIVSGKRWLASSDACPRCMAVDGRVVGLDEPFAVDPKGGPYATVAYPPLHPHCMCTVVEVIA